jgi:hypothetical protein
MDADDAQVAAAPLPAQRFRSRLAVAAPIRRAVVAALLGAAGLLVLYVAIVWLGSRSWAHAVDLLLTDRYYVAAVALGFGTQIGLYTYVRGLYRAGPGMRSSTVVAATGTGTSTTSMIACCLHHVADVLPVVGLSGAAVFLSNYKIPLIVVGLMTNAVGIALMTRIIVHHRRTLVAAPAEAPASNGGHCHTG